MTDRQTDKQNGMTIRLTLCEHDAKGRVTLASMPHVIIIWGVDARDMRLFFTV